MKIVGKKKLSDFWRKHARARKSLEPWVSEVERAIWAKPQDIKDRYRLADILPKNQVVFNLGGNNYRIVVVVVYTAETIHVTHVGTHAEYAKWKLD